MQKSKIFYDEKSDVLYFFIKKGLEEEHREIAPGVSVELDNRGNVLRLEVLNASRVITSVIPPEKLVLRTPPVFVQQTIQP